MDKSGHGSLFGAAAARTSFALLLSCVLCLILLSGCAAERGPDTTTSAAALSPTTGSDETPCMIVERKEAAPGDTQVAITVSVKNNPGILSMTLTVTYDENAMTLVGAESGAAVNEVLTMTAGGTLESGCRFSWDGQDISSSDIKDGAVLVLLFDIHRSAAAGAYEIALACEDIYDDQVSPLTMPTENGIITVG